MLLVISPSKTQDFKSRFFPRFTLPVLIDQSQQLIYLLQLFSPEELSELMQISEQLAQQNWQRFQNFQIPFDLKNAKQALLVFKGDVFSSIDVETYTDEDFEYAQQHVRILSGLYGVLRPLDLMQQYRLEMGLKFECFGAKDLCQFWSAKITKALNKDLLHETEPVLVNLASDEYFRAIKRHALKASILKITFKEYKDGEYKVIAIHAKRARGLMVNYVVTNRLNSLVDLMKFNLEGYQFNNSHSTDEEWVFCRD
jgi:cytoplasmic iron level regulating protein YaaA (DUF328/UPF0246 family)